MDPVQEAMRAELDAVEESFPTAEEAQAQHFMEEFKPAAVTAAKLAELKAKYGGLTIASVEDRKTYDLVHAGRMEIRAIRTEVEKVRKRLKEDSLAWGKKVDSEAKRLTSLLVEIEEPLDLEESRIDAEHERIKAEKQKEKDAELQRRIDSLTAVGHPVTVGDLVTMPATTFAMVLQTATEAWQAKEKLRIEAEAALAQMQESARLDAERAAQVKAEADKAERERQAAIAAENAKESARLEEQRKAIRAEQEKIDAEKARMEREARDKKIAEEAAARAKAEAERLAQEEKAHQEREIIRIQQERGKWEAARPDADKLLALAESLKGTAYPKLSTPEAQKVIGEVEGLVAKLVKFIEDKANSLSPKVTA